ncbi:MAG: ATP-binding cassette domain-containing protein, partial [Thiolinea sp.]
MTELIRVEQLSYRYPKRLVLDEADFALHSSERVSLEGGNGAGKTTFFNLLVGLNKPKSGRI